LRQYGPLSTHEPVVNREVLKIYNLLNKIERSSSQVVNTTLASSVGNQYQVRGFHHAFTSEEPGPSDRVFPGLLELIPIVVTQKLRPVFLFTKITEQTTTINLEFSVTVYDKNLERVFTVGWNTTPEPGQLWRANLNVLIPDPVELTPGQYYLAPATVFSTKRWWGTPVPTDTFRPRHYRLGTGVTTGLVPPDVLTMGGGGISPLRFVRQIDFAERFIGGSPPDLNYMFVEGTMI